MEPRDYAKETPRERFSKILFHLQIKKGYLLALATTALRLLHLQHRRTAKRHAG